MQLNKAMLALGMVRSMGEATRLVKQGAVHVGGCIWPCNMRRCCPDEATHNTCPVPAAQQFKCTCGGWKKVTDFRQDVPEGQVVRISRGDWRLLIKEDDPNAPPANKGKNHHPGFNQLRGVGRVEISVLETTEPIDEPCQDSTEAV
jgi:hypothetical protein